MLQTLTLRGYRGFESYRLADLTRVNLVVGKNNSGKTSILEAVELLVAAGRVTVFHEAARRRGAPALHDRKDRSPAISNLFFGYECKPGAHFELSSQDRALKLSVHVTHLDELEDVNRSHPESAFALSIVNAKEEKTTLPITEDGSIIGYRQSVTFLRQNESLDNPVHFLALESFSFAAMEQAWEEILIHGRESEIVEDMKLLMPDIDSIHFLARERLGGGGILVGRRGVARRVQIGNYGDGVRRLLAFRLALAGAENGFLLIDEIDSGLHWTVMEDIWRLLVQVAERLNVQIFATTHSYDCIRGLGTLVRAHPELAGQVSIHKLERSLPRAVSLCGDRIPVVIEQDIEVR